MIDVPVLKESDQITKARQILRDEGFREVYVTDAKKILVGFIDITDGLRVTATKSNITVEGFIKEAARAGPGDRIEAVARAMQEARTDSAAIVDAQGHISGGVLLADLFPVIICRNELRGTVGKVMTRKVVTADPAEPIERIYSLIVESGFTAFPVVKRNRLVGLISRRDLISSHRVRSAIMQHANREIGDVMTKDVVTISSEDHLGSAAELLVNHDVSRLPVVDGDVLVGIIDRHDVLKGMA
ncbi:MAG TPA: CBS domain-containing protein [Methanoregula sp.]|nr:CBS domain-containing protein [Methanoregula sp.]